VHKSLRTIKADAAFRSFESLGSDITWAVIGSGIDEGHPHFAEHRNLLDHDLHRDFMPDTDEPLIDADGRTTHYAGIIAGELVPDAPRKSVAIYEETWDKSLKNKRIQEFDGDALPRLAAVAPASKIVSLKVRSDFSGGVNVPRVVKALDYIAKRNAGSRDLKIHGVLIAVTLSSPDERRPWGTGSSPLCMAVDELVSKGVVVVTPAGDNGFARLDAERESAYSEMTRTHLSIGLFMTINDPGSAACAITVGSTFRDSPHRYGVAPWSSKGPTADGRVKPDLVAPGQGVVSCGTASLLRTTLKDLPGEPPGGNVYIPHWGTTVAAAHVAGVAAAFLSIHREFIGRPLEVKRILRDSAVSLDRKEEFQGRGLVDLMRALQSV